MKSSLLRLLLVLGLAALAMSQPKAAPTAVNTTSSGMADDHAGHGSDSAGHAHDEPAAKAPIAQNGASKAPMVQNGAHSAAGGHSTGGHGGNTTMAKALPVPDSCVQTPKQGNCSSFDYPHVNAANDLSRLCNAMSFMTSCSIHKACDKAGAGPTGAPTGPGAAKVSSSNSDICKVFNHVATVCRLDTGMSRMGGCENFRSMCVDGSPVAKCKLPGVTSIPTTTAVNTQVRAICEAKPTAAGCADCAADWNAGKKWANCDLLDAYSKQCGADPSLPQCVEYHNMCRADSTLIFCKKYNDAAKKVADSVLKNKGADPESQQATAAGASAQKSAAAGSIASASALFVAVGAAAAMLVL